MSTALRRQLERVTPDFDRDLQILRCGAVEGRTFTAECVAEALEQNGDEVNEELQRVMERQELEHRAVIARCGDVAFSTSEGERALRLHRFVSPWHRLALRAGLSRSDQKDLASRLASALSKQYDPELWRVARTLAELSRWPEAMRTLLTTNGSLISAVPMTSWPLASTTSSALTPAIGTRGSARVQVTSSFDAAYHLRRTKSAIQRHSYTARAQELAARAGNGPLQVRAYNYEAFLEMDRLGELQRAREHLETARRMAEDIPYREGEAWALRELRGLELSVFVDLHSKGKEPDTHAAREAIETVSRAALSKFESLGNVDGQAAVHRNLAAAAVIARDYESARVEYDIALRLERRLGDDYEIALALVELANINALTNRSRDAAMQYREALQLKQASVPWWELVDLTMLVQLAVLVGDQDVVCEHLDEMMQVATTQGDYLAEAHAGDDRTVRSTVTSKSITQFERGAA